MTQRGLETVANVLISVSLAFVVAFLVRHFSPKPHAPWTDDFSWWALAFVCASALFRRRARRRRVTQTVD